jgi:hypothetical protein
LSSSLANYLKTGQSLGAREMGWEHEGNRAYRLGDWKIVSSNFAGTDGKPANKWELYNLATDPTEASDLSGDPQQANRVLLMTSAYDRWAYWTNITATMPWSIADFNRDGQLSQADLQIFIAGWLETSTFGDYSTFVRGDANVDGITDLTDFALLRKAFALTGQLSLLSGVESLLALPEPSTLAQLVFVTLLLNFGWCWREWRQRMHWRPTPARSAVKSSYWK